MLVNITANFKRPDHEYDEENKPHILIQRSTFKNLGFHEVVKGLTRKDIAKKTVSAISSFFDYEFPVFMNRGLILNTQKWPGAIEFSNSTVDENMVYIQDILI